MALHHSSIEHVPLKQLVYNTANSCSVCVEMLEKDGPSGYLHETLDEFLECSKTCGLCVALRAMFGEDDIKKAKEESTRDGLPCAAYLLSIPWEPGTCSVSAVIKWKRNWYWDPSDFIIVRKFTLCTKKGNDPTFVVPPTCYIDYVQPTAFHAPSGLLHSRSLCPIGCPL